MTDFRQPASMCQKLCHQADGSARRNAMLIGINFHEFQQIPNGSMCFDGMPQWLFTHDAVLVLAADFFAFDNTGFFEIGNDSLDGAFRDADLNGDMSQDD